MSIDPGNLVYNDKGRVIIYIEKNIEILAFIILVLLFIFMAYDQKKSIFSRFKEKISRHNVYRCCGVYLPDG